MIWRVPSILLRRRPHAEHAKNDEAAARLVVDSRCELGESILWCAQRNALYWVDITGKRLWRRTAADGQATSWPVPAPLGCIGLGHDGRLLLGLAKGLYACDVTSTPPGERFVELHKLADVEPGDPMTRLNDGRADRNGNFVFGTKSEHPDGRRAGRMYQWSARHGLRALPLPPMSIPNSICFDAAGTRLYFCDSVDRRILRARYDADGAGVAEVELFAELDPGASPDGSTVDAEDALWNAQWGAGRVVRYLPDGRIDRIVHVPAPNTTCCTLVHDELYVTTARIGLGAHALKASPASGGLFAHPLGRPLARLEDRVVLS